MNLKDKVAIITGGASGIGYACCENFLNHGAKVVMADWNENVEEIADKFHNENIIGIRVDVSNEEEVKSLIETTVKKYGKLDIMVANAGIGSRYAAHEETMEEWNQVLGVNLTGVFLSCKYAINRFLEQKTPGAIINTASILGLVGSQASIAYCAAKGAVVNMTRAMAVSYAKENIRVNAIAPGYVETAILKDVPDEILKLIAQAHPIGRLGKSEEIASVVNFLASDEASFLTGAIIPVDGGYVSQ